MVRPLVSRVAILGVLAVLVALQTMLQRRVGAAVRGKEALRAGIRWDARKYYRLKRTESPHTATVQENNTFRPMWREEGMEKEEINFAVHEGIFLTLVMATRNDGYGGNSSRTRVATTLRMINYFAGKYGLAVELLFVEWNPPADRPAVWTTLPWMPNVAVVRVVTVPRWVHEAWSTPHVEVREREGQKVDFLSFVVDGVQVSATV
jgi:hypothetical protein